MRQHVLFHVLLKHQLLDSIIDNRNKRILLKGMSEQVSTLTEQGRGKNRSAKNGLGLDNGRDQTGSEMAIFIDLKHPSFRNLPR